MDVVKVALGTRGMTAEASRQCVKGGKEWRPGDPNPIGLG